MTNPADIVFSNAHIITMDARNSIAQAIAIGHGKILAVGADDAMAPHVGPQTRLFDMKGRTIMPGLIDGHAHMDREGLRKVFPALGRVRSIKDIQDRIASSRATRSRASGSSPCRSAIRLIISTCRRCLPEKRWPTRQELDAAAPNNPVYIRSIWGFWRGTMPLVSCANTEALKRAGITRDTVSPLAVR